MRAHLAPSGLQQDAAIPLAAGRSYLPGFDGLRAIAIAVVFVAHLGWEQSVPGGLGVTLFFFLSGFLITRLLVAEMDERDGRIDLAGFWARRLARLAPPLVVFMAVSGIALWALGVPPELGHVVAGLFYVMNYWQLLTPPPEGAALEAPWGHLWSLAVEEHFYLLFPLLLLVAGRSHRARMQLLLAMIAGGLIWRLVLVHVIGAPTDWTAFASDARIDSIAWGCLLAVMLDGVGRAAPGTPAPLLDWLRSWTWLGLAVLLIGLTVLYRDTAFRETWRYSLQGFAILVIVLNLYTLASARPVLGLLESAPLRLTGRLSYALYLWHLPVTWFLHQHEGPGPLSPGATMVAVLVSFALALASWHFVEKPFWRLRLRFGGRPVEMLEAVAAPVPMPARSAGSPRP